MICKNCNHNNPDNAAVCESCSAPINTPNGKKSPKIKAIIISAVAAVAVCLIVFLILLFTVEARIQGAWISDVNYLEHYSCDCKNTVGFSGDGDYTDMLTDTDGEILKFKEGRWRVSGFTVKVGSEHTSQGATIYKFNPFTGKLTCGIWTYKKA